MNHFLLEFITGGGMADQDLPESLINEGELMLQTLLHELFEIENANIVLTRDARIELKKEKFEQHLISQSLTKELNGLINEDDWCWLIAPETGGALASLAELFISQSNYYMGCSPDAIRLCGSKLETIKSLSGSGIDTLETCLLDESFPVCAEGWVVKPDDGVGAENCLRINKRAELEKFKADKSEYNYIVQPYIKGEHLSMSLLAYNGDVRLLGCNRQYIKWQGSVVKLESIGVNECLSMYDELLAIAKKIVTIIPGLAGYIGVDLIKTDEHFIVLEINPRFTTAYAGLPKSLGINIAEIILDTFLNKKLSDIDISTAQSVRINV